MSHFRQAYFWGPFARHTYTFFLCVVIFFIPGSNFSLDSVLSLFIFCGAATQRGSWPPHSWGFEITHKDAPQSIGLLWTSNCSSHRPLPDNKQHTTLTCPRWDWTHYLSRWAAADLRLRPRGHWDRHCTVIYKVIKSVFWTRSKNNLVLSIYMHSATLKAVFKSMCWKHFIWKFCNF
jgi:hypothetical protein